MTPEQTKAFEEKVYAFVESQSIRAHVAGYDDVNSAMIRQWCEVMGEKIPPILIKIGLMPVAI